MIKIGSLNKQITIQYKVNTPDGMGGYSSTWKDRLVVWAAIWPVSAKEAIQADKNTMTTTHRIRVRYIRNFKPSWRVKFMNRYFSIISVINPNESCEVLDLLCKEAI